MKLETAKGVRDFAPEEKIVREQIVDKLKEIFQRYGFSPLETPSFERFDVLTAKFAAGEGSDAVKEIFKFKDQGERDLGLRFDLTVPLSRFVGMNPTLKMPFKRYEIGRVFRDGPIKLGRYREFWQCDVDVVGVKGMAAEAELLLLALDAFKSLGLDAYLIVNNRKLLIGLIEEAGISGETAMAAITSIDKLDKIGKEGVKKEFETLQVPELEIEAVFRLMDRKGKPMEIIAALESEVKNETARQGIAELKGLFSLLPENADIRISLRLARGLGYYTGTIFEGFLKESPITGSICGGGRYDNMIGMYLENKRDYPAIGISFGLEPITEEFKRLKKTQAKTVTELYIVPIKLQKEAIPIVHEFRKQGIRTDMDLLGKGISKALDYANAMDIPFVGILGSQEYGEGKIKIKEMSTGKEELMPFSDVNSFLANSRQTI